MSWNDDPWKWLLPGVFIVLIVIAAIAMLL